MRVKSSILIFTLFIVGAEIHAQDRFEQFMTTQSNRKRIPEKIIWINKSDTIITLDGDLSEWPWQNTSSASAFRQHFPSDTSLAVSKTEVMFTYDDRNLYVAIISHDELPGEYIVQSLRRDFSGLLNDHVTIYLDPYDDLSNGFVFGITPLGVVKEGLISGGDDVSSNWDNVWCSKVKRYDKRWVAEIRIPFKSIRYNDKATNWNIQINRNDLKRNEISTWTSVPRQFRPWSLAYAGSLLWDSPPPKAGLNIAIIPYIIGSGAKNFENQGDVEEDFNAGFDAKVALSSALNLDITVNPDYSQVDVDQQVTDLSRFELFFPEKRQFFLENNDLFGDYGFPRSRPFFSRRIGLNSQIIAGARLSGKVGDKWRIGLLNVQTQSVNNNIGDDIPAYNFGVVTFQRQVFGRSNIAGIIVNKQALNYIKDQEEDSLEFGGQNEFNRVYGLEYNLLSTDNRLSGNAFIFKSDDPENQSKDLAHGAYINYRWPNLRLGWSHEYIGGDYNAESGFTPRTGFVRFGPFVNYDFYPENSKINRHGPVFRYSNYFNSQGELTDRYVRFSYLIRFLSSSNFEFRINESFIKLSRDFDPTKKSRKDSTVVPLTAGSEYSWYESSLAYRSNFRKNIFFSTSVGYGGYYNGNRLILDGLVNFRFPPILNVGLNFSYNNIQLPDPHADASYWLVGPKIDFTFTDNIFWTTFIQYNQQADNLNINSRFQWRFKPVSDIFLVYTDNYLPMSLNSKNRAIVFKMSYWFNL